MKKKLSFITAIILVASLYFGYSYYQQIQIGIGYGTKAMCSSVFVADRSPESVFENELNIQFLQLGTFKVNQEEQFVTGNFYGIANTKAVYNPYKGCTLIKKGSNQSFAAEREELPIRKWDLLDTIDWPAGDKVSTTLPENIDKEKLDKALEFVFTDNSFAPEQYHMTRGVIVVYDGQIIGEKYAEGFNATSRHIIWSASKSLLHAIVGIMVKQGLLDLNKDSLLPEWENDGRKNITLDHLLHMVSGLKWDEDYGTASSVNKMLFLEPDAAEFAISSPLEFQPGKHFEYSSGTSNIISKIIRNSVGDDKEYYSYPYRELFDKIGMRSVTFETDETGTIIYSSYFYSTARDLARFGLLYLQDGTWQGERILPEGWVSFASTPSKQSKGVYGAHWWTNKATDPNDIKYDFPDVPRDAYMARGYDGQYIFVIPSKKLVVVHVGYVKGRSEILLNNFVSQVVTSLPE